MKITEAKLLRVNLTNGCIGAEQLDSKLLKAYFGGRGVASKILADEVNPKVDPLSEDNKLIISAGLLTGLVGPTTGRYMAVTKSPLTGCIACANSGGFFGTELRKTGFFMIILEGKAPQPSYLSIVDDQVTIHDASHLWGLDTQKTTDQLVEETDTSKAKVCCIGPAGEKLSKIAAIMNDKDRAAGRSGIGAVMGSKNLKAIVVT